MVRSQVRTIRVLPLNFNCNIDMRRIAIVLFIFLAGCISGPQEYPFFGNTGGVSIISGYIDEEQLLSLRASRFANVEVPFVFNYKDQIRNGSIRSQGAGSQYHPKWSYHIKVNPKDAVNGLSNFNLSGQVIDSSLMRTVMATEVYLAAGFPVFTSSHALLSLNGKNEGLYVIIERIDSGFFRRRGIPIAELIKVGHGSHFSFNIRNDPARNFEVQIPYNGNFNDLIEFIHALDTVSADQTYEKISHFLNVREYLRYHAVTSVLRAADNFHNNFYLYKTALDEPFHTMPWDLDLTFLFDDGIQFYGENEIITTLLKNDSCFNIYKAELEDVVKNVFTEERLFPVIDSLTTYLAPAYALSPDHGGLGYSLQTSAQNFKQFIRNRRETLLRDLPSFKK